MLSRCRNHEKFAPIRKFMVDLFDKSRLYVRVVGNSALPHKLLDDDGDIIYEVIAAVRVIVLW